MMTQAVRKLILASILLVATAFLPSPAWAACCATCMSQLNNCWNNCNSNDTNCQAACYNTYDVCASHCIGEVCPV